MLPFLCVAMMRASFIESFNLCSLLLSRFPSPHARSSCSSSSSSSSSSSDVLLARRVFFHPPFGVCVCVCTLYHRTRAGKSEVAFENYSNRR